jgi:signal transduction histidine kinase
MFAFFFIHSADGLVHLVYNKVKLAVWQVGMCLASAVYVCVLFFQTHKGVGVEYSDFLIRTGWTCGILGFFCYLVLIEKFLPRKLDSVKYAKISVAICGAFYLASYLGLNVVYQVREVPEFAKPALVFNTQNTLTPIGRAVGAQFMITVLLINFRILYALIKSPQKEYALMLGVLVSVTCTVNDIVLGTTPKYNLIPIYYLGNVFEALRFSSYFRQKLREKMSKLEKENIESQVRVREGLFTKSLLRVLSHDINNGITVISNGHRRISRLLDSDDDLEKQKLLENNKRIGRGIKTILDTSEVVRTLETARSGMLEVDVVPVDVKVVLEEVEHIFETSLNSKSMTLSIEIKDDVSNVIAEPKILTNQIFNNLLSNAIKFSSEGSQVSVKVWDEEDKVFMKVSDQGIGIPPEILEKLFEQNSITTRKGTSGEVGNGFGMPLMKTFIEVFGGSVFVESETDGANTGTAFTVVLKAA